jgi:predicted acylesterase/phospholipase RssA
MKRAITLAGGGPAAGLHIGVLKRLAEAGINFDVWALSCIGAWVGLVYHQCDPGKEIEQTYKFFRDGVFRDDVSYSRFPVNSVFGADIGANYRAMLEFLTTPESYRNVVLPNEIARSMRSTMEFMSNPAKWNEGDFNRWMLNDVLAVNPYSRFLTSLMYCSNISGLSRIHWPESSFMKDIKFDRLYEKGKPFIFHNAWNITKQSLDLFSNQPNFKPKTGTKYKPITPASLCACSALPYVEETVEIDGDTYCEGALIDTVNFQSLIEDHDVDEVWISRIVDARQVRPPRNIADALGNLCMLFAATVGEDDVKLFRYHVHHRGWKGQIVEIQVSNAVDFEWTRGNLDRGVEAGYQETNEVLKSYDPDAKRPHVPSPRPARTDRALRMSAVMSPSLNEPQTGARIS